MEDLLLGAIEIVYTLSTAIIIFVAQQLNNPVIILTFGIVLFILFLAIVFDSIKNITKKKTDPNDGWVGLDDVHSEDNFDIEDIEDETMLNEMSMAYEDEENNIYLSNEDIEQMQRGFDSYHNED